MLILISTAESPSDAVAERERGGAESQAGWREAKSQLAANANTERTHRRAGCVVSPRHIEVDR